VPGPLRAPTEIDERQFFPGFSVGSCVTATQTPFPRMRVLSTPNKTVA
jgi:hypothetical protein